MENLPFLIGAYFLFWLLTTGYLLTLDRRQKEIDKALKKLLSQKEGAKLNASRE